MSLAEIKLRRALTSDDIAVWGVRAQAIRISCRGHYDAKLLENWASTPMPPLFGATIAREVFIVAESTAGIVGFAGLMAESGEIDAVFVSPDFAGQGLGARMLGQLEGLAIGLGIRAVTLKASLNSVGFYLGAGYTARESGWHVTDSGLRLACVHMEKSLARPADV
jgi:GNAT superfamily N-acetyltransferase